MIAKTLLCYFCLSEVDARHASRLFTIQGELEDLSSFLGWIFLVAVTKDDGLASVCSSFSTIPGFPTLLRAYSTACLNAASFPELTAIVCDDPTIYDRGTWRHIQWFPIKFPRKCWEAMHAQTMSTRHFFQFLEHLGTRLSMYPTLLDVMFDIFRGIPGVDCALASFPIEGLRTRVDQPKIKYWKLHELCKNAIKTYIPYEHVVRNFKFLNVQQLLKCILRVFPC